MFKSFTVAVGAAALLGGPAAAQETTTPICIVIGAPKGASANPMLEPVFSARLEEESTGFWFMRKRTVTLVTGADNFEETRGPSIPFSDANVHRLTEQGVIACEEVAAQGVGRRVLEY